eukprot:304335_1
MDEMYTKNRQKSIKHYLRMRKKELMDSKATEKLKVKSFKQQINDAKNKYTALQQTYAALEKQANTLKSICKSYEQEKTLIELMKKQKIVLEQEKKELMDTRNDAKNKYTVLQQTNATLQKQA